MINMQTSAAQRSIRDDLPNSAGMSRSGVAMRDIKLLQKSEWKDLRLVWFVVAVSLVLTQVFPPAAGLWFAGWISWAIMGKGGRLVPSLLLASVPISHNVFPGGVNLSVVEVGLVLAGIISISSAPRQMGPLLIPIAMYLGICFLTMGMNYRGKAALTSIVQTGVYLVLAISVFFHYVKTERHILLAVVGLMGTSLFLSLLSMVQGGGGYIFGIHKNNLGATTSAATVCSMAVWLHVRQTRKPKAWQWVLLLLSLGLFMSLSRGGWVAAVVGAVSLAAVYRQWRVVGSLGFIGVVIAVIGFAFLPDHHQNYVLGSVDSETHSYEMREINADFAMDRFKSSPVFGVGVGLRKQYDATNIVLGTLAETGALGLLAFLMIHVSAGKTLMRSYRIAKPGSLTLMVAGLALALIFGRLAHGLVDHYWSRGAITSAWCLVGAGLSLTELRRRQFLLHQKGVSA